MRFPALLALAAALAACGGNPEPAAEPAPPAPAPAPAPAPQPAPRPALVISDPLTVCVLQAGQLAFVRATYVPERGDTLVDGRPFREVHPAAPPYATGSPFFEQNLPLPFRDRRLVKYGLARVLPAEALARVSEYEGVPLFGEAGEDPPSVVYVPVRPGCEFQPYQVDYIVGSVRGE